MKWKYTYSESITKSSEGGIPGGVTVFLGLNKQISPKFKGKVRFVNEQSYYVGQWSARMWATDAKSFAYGFKLAKSEGFFTFNNLREALRQSKQYFRGGW